MKNFMKILSGISSLMMLVIMINLFCPGFEHSMYSHLPHWADVFITGSGGVGCLHGFTVGGTSTSGGVINITKNPSAAIQAATLQAQGKPVVVTQSYRDNGTSSPGVHVMADNNISATYAVVYTVANTYVAFTDIPIIPYTTTDTLPTGITAAFGGNFTNQAAYTAWYGQAQKQALYGNIDFACDTASVLPACKMRYRDYTDVHILSRDVTLGLNIVAPNWQNQYQLQEQWTGDTNYLSGDPNHQYTFEGPAITCTITVTFFLKDTHHGALVSEARA